MQKNRSKSDYKLRGEEVALGIRIPKDKVEPQMQDSLRPEHRPQASAFPDYFTPGRFAVILGVLLLVSFPQVLIFGQSFVFRDFGLFNYPLAFYVRESFSGGQIPLWNPYNNGGIPFLAQWNTQVLYPFSWIYLLIPLPWSLSFSCLLHLFFAGMGMYFLAWKWTGNRLAATLAGTAFVFNGFMLQCLMWPHYMAAFAWMPWTILTMERAWATGGRRILTAAVVGTMQMLAGAPEMILMTWTFLTIIAAVRLFRHRSEATTTIVRFILVVLLITGLSAAQLAPFLDFLTHSQRNAGFNITNWSMPLFGLGNFLVPLFRTYASPTGVSFLYGQGFTSSYYMGIGVSALSLIALWRVRDPRVKVLGIASLCCVVFALGDEGYVFNWARTLFPAFALMRYPIKFIILLTFVVPLLMAFAVPTGPGSVAQKTNWRRSSLAVSALFAGLILFIIWFSRAHPYKEESWIVTCRSGLTRLLFLFGTLLAFYFLLRTEKRKTQLLLSFALIGLFWFDAISHTPSQNPVVSTEAFRPGLPGLHELSPQPALGGARAMLSTEAWHALHEKMLPNAFDGYICYRLGMFDNCNLLDRLPKVDGIFSMYLREESEVRKRLYGNTNLATHVADFLSVGQITAPGKYFDWQARPGFMPMITGGQKPVFLRTEASLETLFGDFNPRQTVYLPLEAKPFISATNATEVKIGNQNWGAHRISFDVEAAEAAMVVLSQTHYHPWKAYVDNTPTPIFRANHAYQALQVTAGRHHVELIYDDRIFYAGAGISGMTLLICGVAFFRSRRNSIKADQNL